MKSLLKILKALDLDGCPDDKEVTFKDLRSIIEAAIRVEEQEKTKEVSINDLAKMLKS